MSDLGKKKKKAINVQYRKVTAPVELLLQSSLQTALSRTMDQPIGNAVIGEDVAARLYKLDDDRAALLNTTSIRDDYFFGQLAVFKPDGLIPLIAQYKTPVAELPISQDKPLAGSDVLHGLLYFMAIGNHSSL